MDFDKIDKILKILYGISIIVVFVLFISEGNINAAVWAALAGFWWVYALKQAKIAQEKEELMKRHDEHLISALENSREIELISLISSKDEY